MGSHAKLKRHGRTHEPAASEPPHRLLLVQWMVTQRCPLSCEHCLAAGDEPLEDMPRARAARLIEEVAEMSMPEFLLTGGEPLARPDLPDIIDVLRANGVRWSLNTALMPDRRVRGAMEKWPPGFVAVSVDGPEEVHDAFRGRPGTFRRAMEAVGYFADLAPGAVAAGTTVTTRNFEYLPVTFGLVMESGASQWGLHLTVPEGRAAFTRDLLLAPRQLKELLRFATAKRRHFPVTMADEIGYCGFWEPFVRNEPFYCGAGRAQCVVLPDGAVVPCTTFDRAESAGNLNERPLREIWETGFEELRSWTARGRCASCAYAPACRGGCWLQRRHGGECFRYVWHVPAARTAAGLAVCIGLAAAGLPDEADAREPLKPPAAAEQQEPREMEVLQAQILEWYAGHFRRWGSTGSPPDKVKEAVAQKLPDDPGAKYFLKFLEGKRPKDIAKLSEEILPALQTRQRSLCLAGLMWRDLTEWCLAEKPPAERTAEERRILRETMTNVGRTVGAWSSEIFMKKLDPFLRRPIDYRGFLATKAMTVRFHTMQDRIGYERYRRPDRLYMSTPVEMRYAESMKLRFEEGEASALRFSGPGGERSSKEAMSVFEIMLTPKDRDVTLIFPVNQKALRVTLPRAAELSYADVLKLVHQQNTDWFAAVRTYDMRSAVHREILQPSPLFLPELRRRKAEMEKLEKPPADLPYVRWLLTDIYLF